MKARYELVHNPFKLEAMIYPNRGEETLLLVEARATYSIADGFQSVEILSLYDMDQDNYVDPAALKPIDPVQFNLYAAIKKHLETYGEYQEVDYEYDEDIFRDLK